MFCHKVGMRGWGEVQVVSFMFALSFLKKTYSKYYSFRDGGWETTLKRVFLLWGRKTLFKVALFLL